MKVESESEVACVRLLATPWTAAYQAPRPWDFPSKSTGVGCHCLLRLGLLLEINELIFAEQLEHMASTIPMLIRQNNDIKRYLVSGNLQS